MNWKLTEDGRTPICYEVGDWDGSKSDPHLVQDDKGEYHVAEMYEGILDGSKFADWYSTATDYILENVVRWTEITD